MGNGHGDTSQAAHHMIRRRLSQVDFAKDEQWARYNEKELTLLDRISPDKSMSKEVFLDYFNLPGILGERLFDVFDTKKDGVIKFDAFKKKNQSDTFSYTLEQYNRGSMNEKIDMLFEMYGLDGQECITKEELGMVLFSLVTPTTSIFYDGGTNRTIDGTPGKGKHLSKKKKKKTNIFSKTLDPVNDTENLFRLSEMTRKTVNHLVDDAFAQNDQQDSQKLSRGQFREWVSRNPAAMEVLNTEFAKHVWGEEGSEDTKIAATSELTVDDNGTEGDTMIDEDQPHVNHPHAPSVNNGEPVSTSPKSITSVPHPLERTFSYSQFSIRHDSPRRVKSMPSPNGLCTNLARRKGIKKREREKKKRRGKKKKKNNWTLGLDKLQREAYEDHFCIYTCKGCGFKFTKSIQKIDMCGTNLHTSTCNNNNHNNSNNNNNNNSNNSSNSSNGNSSNGNSNNNNNNNNNNDNNNNNSSSSNNGSNHSSLFRGELVLKYCIQCGGKLELKEIMRLEPLVNLNTAVSRTCTKASIQKKGTLFKIGRTTGGWVERTYVLKDKFLYMFKFKKKNIYIHVYIVRPSDEKMPTDALFVQGWFIEPFEDQYARGKDKNRQYFGIEFQPPQNIGSQSLRRYAKSKEERDNWVIALRRAASTVSLA
ncbi:hypothetical protein RFI_09663, partial [Reticulomyxa filosa]